MAMQLCFSIRRDLSNIFYMMHFTNCFNRDEAEGFQLLSMRYMCRSERIILVLRILEMDETSLAATATALLELRFKEESLPALQSLLDQLTTAEIEQVFEHQRSHEGNGLNTLHWACVKADLRPLKYLLSRGVDVNKRDRPGDDTVLNYAAGFDKHAVVKLLLEHGADVNAPGMLNWTPLVSASGSSGTKSLKLLLAAGADPNRTWAFEGIAKQPQLGQALHIAAANNRLGAIKLLIEHGCDINGTGGGIMTALHSCLHDSEKPKMGVAQYFIKHGLDVSKAASFAARTVEVLTMLSNTPAPGLRLSPKLNLDHCPTMPAVRYITMGLEGRILGKTMAYHQPQLDKLRRLYPNLVFCSYPIKLRRKTYDIGHGAITARCLPQLSDYRYALDILFVRFINRVPVDPKLFALSVALIESGINLEDTVWCLILRQAVLVNCEHTATVPQS
eukprot:m.169760 g.169760  ORF g.169760 m.169760 type:complete len:447 (-) comp16672_c0_seq7:1639-2979(-)